MALNPGSTQTVTTISTNSTPQTTTVAGLSTAEMVVFTNTGSVPVNVAWFDLRGVVITPGHAVGLWPGPIGTGGGGFPFPTVDLITVSSSAELPGQLSITVQS